jgi:ribosomal protein S17E
MTILNFTNYFTQKFLDPLQNVVVFKNIITQDTCNQVAEYATKMYSQQQMSKNSTGKNRWRHRVKNTDSRSINEIIDTFNQIFAKYNGIPDDKIGNIITFNISDSCIHRHQDDYGQFHLRINLIVEKPEFCGNPVIQGLLYKILPGDGWMFSPSHTQHGTTWLTSGRRINLSMGWNFNNLQDYENAFISISS